MNKNIIGLDWDGVVSDYGAAFSYLVQLFQHCIIITVNDTITHEIAADVLNIEKDKISIEICPDNRIVDYPTWKAEKCLKHHVDIMFDDDPNVVLACQEEEILAITVSEYIYRYG
ncbi:hypothetical protein PN36_21720 [Candidatus Thiomargarita nelsonii]|uniref:HAD family hydrolase n=1 Tax=Candidatus Thiomargarita nelsonii TaxID=1003181 RepID=A0A0A6RQU2_9GAMM|nr:hypothetical protein PN36_21720 [Candidatus Thiomargarita nelsonii]